MSTKTWTLTFTPPGEPAHVRTGVPHVEALMIVRDLMYGGTTPSREHAEPTRAGVYRDPRLDLTARAA